MDHEAFAAARDSFLEALWEDYIITDQGRRLAAWRITPCPKLFFKRTPSTRFLWFEWYKLNLQPSSPGTEIIDMTESKQSFVADMADGAKFEKGLLRVS